MSRVDMDTSNSEPAGPSSAPLIYRPREGFRWRTIATTTGIGVACLLLTVPAAASGSVLGVVILLAIAIAMAVSLWTYLRRRVTLTAGELIVQSRLSRLRVPLATITAVHYDQTGRERIDRHRLDVWVAAAGIRPFRIYFLAGSPTFVADVRRRATACGAPLDPDAPDQQKAPADTRWIFTLV